MSAAIAMALPERQRQLLAHMGIEVYVRRVARAEHGESDGRVDAAPARGPPVPAVEPAPRLLLRIDGDARSLLARHGRLVDHLVAALGLERASARIDGAAAAPAGVPVLCLGAAPGDHPRAILAPPLPALAASGRAKAGLWRALRRLRAELEGA